MKRIIITVLLLISYHTIADDCLRYMNGRDSAKFIFKKKCSKIMRSNGRIDVLDANICFSKLKDQFPNKVSYALVADLEVHGRLVPKDVIIVNSSNALETTKNINFEKATMSPELLKRYYTNINFNKETNILSIVRSDGLFYLNNRYKFEVMCN